MQRRDLLKEAKDKNRYFTLAFIKLRQWFFKKLAVKLLLNKDDVDVLSNSGSDSVKLCGQAPSLTE